MHSSKVAALTDTFSRVLVTAVKAVEVEITSIVQWYTRGERVICTNSRRTPTTEM